MIRSVSALYYAFSNLKSSFADGRVSRYGTHTKVSITYSFIGHLVDGAPARQYFRNKCEHIVPQRRPTRAATLFRTLSRDVGNLISPPISARPMKELDGIPEEGPQPSGIGVKPENNGNFRRVGPPTPHSNEPNISAATVTHPDAPLGDLEAKRGEICFPQWWNSRFTEGRITAVQNEGILRDASSFTSSPRVAETDLASPDEATQNTIRFNGNFLDNNRQNTTRQRRMNSKY